jgi:hypothetical protein
VKKAARDPAKPLTDREVRAALTTMLEDIEVPPESRSETLDWLIRKFRTAAKALNELRVLKRASWRKEEVRTLLTSSRDSLVRSCSDMADLQGLLVNGYGMKRDVVVMLYLRYPSVAEMTRQDLEKKLRAATGYAGTLDDHVRVLREAPELLAVTTDQIGRRRMTAESRNRDPLAHPRLLLKTIDEL